MVWLFAYFQSSFALQSGQPFARHNVLSTAASADREFGSGAWLDSERFFDLQSTLGRTTLGSCGTRFGEARHPGPHHDYLTVGVSNPGGLRQKEETLLHLGPGLWSMTETQLSAVTMKTCAGLIRQQAKILNRQVRPLFGAPASLRMGSQWAGTWTGVCTCSDWPAATLQIPWPDEHWETGRVLLSRHWISGMPVVIGAFYGYAQGPTWPKSKSLSDKLLSTFTTEVVMGMSGVRILQGDFNYEPGEIPQQRIWQNYGWCNAQQLAHELFIMRWCQLANIPINETRSGYHLKQLSSFVASRSPRTFVIMPLLRSDCRSPQLPLRFGDGPDLRKSPGMKSTRVTGSRTVALNLTHSTTPPIS